MSKCPYCGESAGFLKKKHIGCETKHEQAKKRILEIVEECITKGQDYASCKKQIDINASEGRLSDAATLAAITGGWDSVIESYLDDALLDNDEEAALARFKSESGLSQEILDTNGSMTKSVQAAFLRELTTTGTIPKKLSIGGAIPFNLQKGEELAWLFNDVRYLEERTQRTYVGGSQGASVRVAKGVYYRASAFKGSPVDTKVTVPVDVGTLGITQKHIYFAGPSKSFRVPYGKIVTFVPFDDGIGIHRDAASAKPQMFITGNGWFIYNLVTNLADLAKS